MPSHNASEKSMRVSCAAKRRLHARSAMVMDEDFARKWDMLCIQFFVEPEHLNLQARRGKPGLIDQIPWILSPTPSLVERF